MNLISELPPNQRDAWYECMINHAYEAEEWENARQLLVRLLKKDEKRANGQTKWPFFPMFHAVPRRYPLRFPYPTSHPLWKIFIFVTEWKVPRISEWKSGGGTRPSSTQLFPVGLGNHEVFFCPPL
jgi:hypothetical protein